MSFNEIIEVICKDPWVLISDERLLTAWFFVIFIDMLTNIAVNRSLNGIGFHFFIPFSNLLAVAMKLQSWLLCKLTHKTHK